MMPQVFTKPVRVHLGLWRDWLYHNDFQINFHGVDPPEMALDFSRGMVPCPTVELPAWVFNEGGFFVPIQRKGYATPVVGRQKVFCHLCTNRGWQAFREIIKIHWAYPKATFEEFEECVLDRIKCYNENAARRRAKGIDIKNI